MKKNTYLLLVILFLITAISAFTVSTTAATLNAPQDMDGLQRGNIVLFWGDDFIFNDPVLTDAAVSTSEYTSGLSLSNMIVNSRPGNNTKVRIAISLPSSLEVSLNALCLSNVPSDFKITISGSGTSLMTGSEVSQAFNYVSQANGWYRYDTFSTSASQTPVFATLTQLLITIDGGSAFLSTLADDDITLSFSMIPYNQGISDDLQYQAGYNDAKSYYSDLLRQDQERYFNRGVAEGKAIQLEDDLATLVPEARSDGYQDGYAVGRQDGLHLSDASLLDVVTAIPTSVVTSIGGFLDIELLGFNLRDVFGGLILLSIFIFIGSLVLKKL